MLCSGTKVKLFQRLQEGADAPCYWSNQAVLPSEKGGVKGYIVVKEESGCDGEENENEEEGEGIQKSETYYRWDAKAASFQSVKK